jgi:hypothetical protein
VAHTSTTGRIKPVPRTQRLTTSRALQRKRDDTIQDISVSLMDMDSAIMFYFENVIKPQVVENGETIKVPVMYSSPERWATVQKTGFMRDAKRQIIIPAIAFRRTGMEKDDTIPIDKIDPEEPKFHYSFEKKYNSRNRYDNFSKQIGLLPQREYYNVAMPDYMILSYDFIVWTHYIEQMNKLIERINWSAGSYWGEPNRMRFRTNIDSYTDATEVTDKERLIRTEFSVTLRGYLIPEAFNELAGPHTTATYTTPSQVIVGTETALSVPSTMEQITGIADIQGAVATLGSSPSPSVTLSNSFTLSSGTGVTLTNDGFSFDGSTDITQTISIGQAVSTTDNVQFNSVTSSLLVGSSNPLTFNNDGITGDISITGSLTTTDDLSVTGNTTIAGTLTAQEFHTEYVSASMLSISGSTRFGDTIDDTHYFTGSMYLSGSLELNKYSVNEISNDTSLTDNSSTALVTEYAVKQYIDSIGSGEAEQTYLRKQYVKLSTTLVNSSTASFSAVTASAPVGMTSTTEHDFLFFINGQYMEHDALTIQQAASTFYLQVDTDGIGYDLESDDEILAWGKFNS